MNQNSFFRTDKLSLLLFGTGVGLLSLASSAKAQEAVRPPSIILRQAVSMASDCEIDLTESPTQDGYQLRVKLPDSVSSIEMVPSSAAYRSFRIVMDDPAANSPATDSTNSGVQPYGSGIIEYNHAVRNPLEVLADTNWEQAKQNALPEDILPVRPPNTLRDLLASKRTAVSTSVEQIEMQLNEPKRQELPEIAPSIKAVAVEYAAPQSSEDTSSILVDSVAFLEHSNHQSHVRQAHVSEMEQATDFKFPAKVSSLRSNNEQIESLQIKRGSWAPKASAPNNDSATLPKPAISTDARFAQMKVSDSIAEPNRFVPAASSLPTEQLPTVDQIAAAKPLGDFESAQLAKPILATKSIQKADTISVAESIRCPDAPTIAKPMATEIDSLASGGDFPGTAQQDLPETENIPQEKE